MAAGTTSCWGTLNAILSWFFNIKACIKTCVSIAFSDRKNGSFVSDMAGAFGGFFVTFGDALTGFREYHLPS